MSYMRLRRVGARNLGVPPCSKSSGERPRTAKHTSPRGEAPNPDKPYQPTVGDVSGGG